MTKTRRVGRPSKLTHEVRRRLISAITAGNYYETACKFAGITYATFRNWLNRGERARSGQYFDFFEEVTRAEAEAEARMVAQWQAQIPEDWRAARDFLARRHPERWGPKEQIDLAHSGEVVQKHDNVKVTEELLGDREFLSALQRAVQEREKESSLWGDSGSLDSGDGQ